MASPARRPGAGAAAPPGSASRAASSTIHGQLKLVVLGETNAGKTALVGRYIQNRFLADTAMTIGATFSTKLVRVDNGSRIKVQIWDTAGQERFRSMASLYYRSARAAVVVCDLTSKRSLKGAFFWATQLRKECPDIVLGVVGNKSDLVDDILVQPSQMEGLAEKFDARLFTTSAKTGEGIREMFESLVNEALAGHLAELARLATAAAGQPSNYYANRAQLDGSTFMFDPSEGRKPGCC
jgi:small GTP-binding protein